MNHSTPVAAILNIGVRQVYLLQLVCKGEKMKYKQIFTNSYAAK